MSQYPNPTVPGLRLLSVLCTRLFPVFNSSRWVVPKHRKTAFWAHRVWEGRPGRATDRELGQGLRKGAAGCLLLAELAVHRRQGRAVAMAMDQPKQGAGSKLLDKLVLKSAHYRMLKKLKMASIL